METQEIYNEVVLELSSVLESPDPDFISAIVAGLEKLLSEYAQCHKYIFFVDEKRETHLVCLLTILSILHRPKKMMVSFALISKEKFEEISRKMDPGAALFIISKT